MIVGISAAALIAGGVLAVYKRGLDNKPISMVAVLPFENATGDAANEYLGNGISESLINKLSGLSDLHVISRTSAFAFKGKATVPTEIGKKLGVDALVLGSLTLDGSRVPRRATRRRTDSTSRDASFWSVPMRRWIRAFDFFQQAVARAPDYAMAYAGLADVYSVQAFLGASGRTEAAEKARAAATRALELDRDLGEVHSALAGILFLFEWDWARTDAEYRRGLALSPGSEAVHEAYGGFHREIALSFSNVGSEVAVAHGGSG